MKRIILTIVLLLPLALFIGCSTESDEQPCALYQKYASQQDLTVAQICDFELCDTVSIDVVLLVANDENAWQRLTNEFDIRCDSGSTSWLAPIDQPAQRTTWNNECVLRIVASPERRTVGLYRLENEEQYDALFDYQLNNMKK